jgi:hypothetical protein
VLDRQRCSLGARTFSRGSFYSRSLKDQQISKASSNAMKDRTVRRVQGCGGDGPDGLAYEAMNGTG